MGVTPAPDPEVYVGIASFGRRAKMLQAAVVGLLDQVDRIGVYLNDYAEVPGFLKDPRIEVARSQDHGDLRDNGKFFFLQGVPHRYYAAADDDIEYPPDYIARLKSALTDAGPRAAVGVHGAVYPTRIIGLAKPRRLYHYLDSLQHVMPVHLIGTGTLMFEQATWDLQFEEFGEPGMADVWFASAARKREAPLFVVNRGREWLTDIPAPEEHLPGTPGSRLYAEAKMDDSVQVHLLSGAGVTDGGFKDLVESLLESDRFAEDLTLSQAVALDDVRREMGWLPLDRSLASSVHSRLSALRASWQGNPLCSGIDIDAYSAVAVGVLTGDAAADVVGRALDSLQAIASLAEMDRDAWRSLPYPLRFDTRGIRHDKLRAGLLGRAIRRSQSDARVLWPRLLDSAAIPIDLAIEVERAGIDTRLQRLPGLKAAAAKNPIGTASLLRDFFEEREWSVNADVLAWKRAFGSSFTAKEVQLLLCLTAARTGNLGMARRSLESLRHRWPGDFDVRMMEAVVSGLSTGGARKAMLAALEILDGVLGHIGLRPYRGLLRHHDSDVSHWTELFDQAHEAHHRGEEEDPQVSVIMTVYNDAATVRAAIMSILSSQGVPLELIVVDDASSDGTADVVAALSDRRVKVVRNPQNLGPYVSRNRALEMATGEYITIADADDWTHPDRVAYQCARLTDEKHLLGCTVAHVRLRPDGQPDLENNLLFMGHGPVSLMFRRSVVDQIGGFDHVRTRGDIEFIRRLKARFGPRAIASYEVPLILATSRPTSNSKLFSSEALGRYRRAARQWHADNELSDALYVNVRGEERASFIAPEELMVPPAVVTASR